MIKNDLVQEIRTRKTENVLWISIFSTCIIVFLSLLLLKQLQIHLSFGISATICILYLAALFISLIMYRFLAKVSDQEIKNLIKEKVEETKQKNQKSFFR